MDKDSPFIAAGSYYWLKLIADYWSERQEGMNYSPEIVSRMLLNRAIIEERFTIAGEIAAKRIGAFLVKFGGAS